MHDDEVVGFASLSPYKERAAYRTTVEDSVYVRRDHHGKGIGKALLGEMLDVARRHGFHSVMARIEATREPSVALHRSCGFELVGIEREVGRKFNRWLDIALMQRLSTPETSVELNVTPPLVRCEFFPLMLIVLDRS